MANHHDYADFLRGKAVALVGGHDHIDWDRVNLSDVVIRINGHWARQGGRIDSIYDSCASDICHKFYNHEDVRKQLKFAMLNITHIFFSHEGSEYRKITKTLCDYNIPWDFYVHAPAKLFSVMEQLKEVPPRHQWYVDWIHKWGLYPLTGILAIQHLLQQPISSLYIDGMDLGRSQIKNQKSKRSWLGLHYLPPQIKYLREAVITNPKVRTSRVFWRAVMNEPECFE